MTYISPDRPVTGLLDHAVASVNADFKNIGTLDGKGVGVAVLDSGIQTSADLRSQDRVVYAADLTGGNDPSDHFGHGTHVASIIGGTGELSSGNKSLRTMAGIAPGVNIISLKVLDDQGQGSESSVIRGIYTAIALKNEFNIRVINLSLGHPVLESYKLDPLCQAVERAWKAGILVVVAAGNEGRNNLANTHGYGMIMSPANDPYVLTVGAMKDMSNNGDRIDDRIASYSSKGPSAYDHVVKPDLVAPGNAIIASAFPDSYLWSISADSSKVLRTELENTDSTAFTQRLLPSERDQHVGCAGQRCGGSGRGKCTAKWRGFITGHNQGATDEVRQQICVFDRKQRDAGPANGGNL